MAPPRATVTFSVVAGLTLALSALAATTTLAPAESVGAATRSDIVEAHMATDDECSDEACSLNVLQLRSQIVESQLLEEARIDLTVGLAKACSADPVADYASQVAPRCFRACPALCSAALPVLAAIRGGAALDCSALLDESHGLGCLMDKTNEEACQPVTRQLSLIGVSSPANVLSRCAADGGASDAASLVEQGLERRRSGGSQAAVANAESHRQQMLDMALTGKEQNPLCAKSEGKTCASSHTWIYCAPGGYKMSGQPSNCESEVGAKSLCKPAAPGEKHDFCDDPFCRNGEAYLGDGRYCQKDHVVLCTGSNAPKIVDMCENKVWTDSQGRTRNTQNHCVGAPPKPACLF